MRLVEPPPTEAREHYLPAHDEEYEQHYEPPTLSPSQKAFGEDPQGFLQRLEERAATLFESGYVVYPTNEAFCFAVVHHVIRAGATDSEYFVRPLEGTCSCPFFMWQQKGDYLGEQGESPTLVPCKHLRGLSLLVRKTRDWLYKTGQSRAYCALTVPWIEMVILRWKHGHRGHNGHRESGIGSDAVCTQSTYRGVRERRKKRRSSDKPKVCSPPRPTTRKEVSE